MSTEITSEVATTSLPPNAEGDGARLGGRIASALAGRWRIVPILVALAIIWAFFGAQSPIFLSSRNLTNLANQISVSTFLALGLVFLVLVQQIDISLAAVAAMAGGTAAVL